MRRFGLTADDRPEEPWWEVGVAAVLDEHEELAEGKARRARYLR